MDKYKSFYLHHVSSTQKEAVKSNFADQVPLNPAIRKQTLSLDDSKCTTAGVFYSAEANGTHWLKREKEAFFSALARYSIHDLRSIKDAIPSKSEVQILTYYNVLKSQCEELKASGELRPLSYTQIPIAYEMDQEFVDLEEAYARVLEGRPDYARLVEKAAKAENEPGTNLLIRKNLSGLNEHVYGNIDLPPFIDTELADSGLKGLPKYSLVGVEEDVAKLLEALVYSKTAEYIKQIITSKLDSKHEITSEDVENMLMSYKYTNYGKQKIGPLNLKEYWRHCIPSFGGLLRKRSIYGSRGVFPGKVSKRSSSLEKRNIGLLNVEVLKLANSGPSRERCRILFRVLTKRLQEQGLVDHVDYVDSGSDWEEIEQDVDAKDELSGLENVVDIGEILTVHVEEDQEIHELDELFDDDEADGIDMEVSRKYQQLILGYFDNWSGEQDELSERQKNINDGIKHHMMRAVEKYRSSVMKTPVSLGDKYLLQFLQFCRHDWYESSILEYRKQLRKAIRKYGRWYMRKYEEQKKDLLEKEFRDTLTSLSKRIRLNETVREYANKIALEGGEDRERLFELFCEECEKDGYHQVLPLCYKAVGLDFWEEEELRSDEDESEEEEEEEEQEEEEEEEDEEEEEEEDEEEEEEAHSRKRQKTS